MSAAIDVPVLPAPLRAVHRAEAQSGAADALTLRAGAQTDWFIDPAGGPVVHNAPAVLMSAPGTWMLRACASVQHAATFDAAVLVVYADERTWAKLCLERAPSGELMVVSVVTRGGSDDCNSTVVAGETWLRVARLENAIAFHYSSDGKGWQLVRYFSLGTVETLEVGFLAQSPTGAGCSATFRGISFIPQLLKDIRSGQ